MCYYDLTPRFFDLKVHPNWPTLKQINSFLFILSGTVVGAIIGSEIYGQVWRSRNCFVDTYGGVAATKIRESVKN